MLAAGAVVATALAPTGTAQGAFRVEETSIARIHAAMRRGELSCVALTRAYLRRIAAYDDRGPALNAVIATNPDALAIARRLDRRARGPRGRFRASGPLHCVPILAKDNYDTADMPTTAGHELLAGSTPPDDATMVARLRRAGALILGKTNMDELARGSSGLSSLGGQTRNAYDPLRIPGGSSAGTGTAIAANFATAGLATETGVSIRNPATNNNLVGLAPTRGRMSQDGIVPISFTQDRGGPHARNVADAAALFEVMAGYDAKDPKTADSVGRGRIDYTAAPSETGLRGARIGVVEELFGDEEVERESSAIVRRAVRELRRQGATIVGRVEIQRALDARLPSLDPVYPNDDRSFLRVLSDTRTNDFEQRYALDGYFAARAAGGGTLPVRTTDELARSGRGLPSLMGNLLRLPPLGIKDPAYVERQLRMAALRSATLKAMADAGVDALVFPMKTQIAPLIGARGEPPARITSGGNILGPITGFPSITVPAGFTESGMPVGMELLGRPFDEWSLLRYASDYEAATQHRRSPPTAPPLRR